MNIVFLHGYGANKEDLMPLEQVLRSSTEQKFHFLDAPHLLQPSHFGGRSWFEINAYELMKLQQGNLDFSNSTPVDLAESLKFIKRSLDNLDITDLYLGGFSQGSMCALHFYLKYFQEYNFKGLVLYSSTLVAKDLVNKFTGPAVPVFQSHGKQDPILRFEYAKTLEKELNNLSFNVDFLEFSGGHEIPMKVIQKSKEFLASSKK